MKTKDYKQEELEKMLSAAFEYVEKGLCEYYGYNDLFSGNWQERIDLTKVKINKRLRSSAGKCKWNESQKKYIIELHPETEEVIDTLRHEALHMITMLSDNKEFERLCNKLNIGFTHSESFNTMEDYKYVVRCSECGQIIRKQKRRSRVIKSPDLYRSTCCEAKLEVEEI